MRHHCSYFRHCCNYATIENTVFFEISEVSKRKSWLVKNKYIINKIKVKRDSKNQSTFSTEPTDITRGLPYDPDHKAHMVTIPWWENVHPLYITRLNYPRMAHGNNCNVGFLAGNVEVINIYDLHEDSYKNKTGRIQWHWKDLEK